MIYNFYIADNECNNEIYELHYNMLNQISYKFDKIIFILNYDGNPYDDIVKRVKLRLINEINCNDITFIYEQNIPKWRQIGKGINLYGICNINNCEAKGKQVIMHVESDEYDVYDEYFKGICPICKNDFNFLL